MTDLQKQNVFSAISHPARREILTQLKKSDLSASELAKPFGMSFPAVSQHLKVLREAELVTEERSGRQRIYHLNPTPLKEIWKWANEVGSFWNSKLDALENHLDAKYPRNKK